MASIVSDLHAKMFTSEFALLKCACSDESMTFAIKKGEAEILSQTYFPDDAHFVYIYDLDRLLESYIGEYSGSFTLIVNGIPVKTVMVIRCLTAIDERAETFHTDYFFTPSTAERDTALGRYETVTMYCDEATMITAECTYLLPDGSIKSKIKPLLYFTGWKAADVSPAKFADSEGRLISYVVKAGSRRARYRVLANPPEANPAFIFRNSFGCWETIYLTGARQLTPSYSRSNANIEGRNISYDIEETMTLKAFTGPLRPGMVPVALDLARAKEIYLLDSDGNAGDRITITEADVKHTNEDDTIPDFAFTYRRSDRRSALISMNRPPRIFDNTFDQTYE